MPATTTTTELFSKAAFTLSQVQEQRDLRIQAGAIRSTIDETDALNFILTTEWNVIGGNDDATSAPAPGVGHAMADDAAMTSDSNVTNLATVLMSEASVGNSTERTAVGWTLLNRLQNKGLSAVDQVWSAYAHTQTPTVLLIALARQLLAGEIPDITEGATHFYSPISMPKEGQPTGGFDVAGGLELVPPLTERNFAPSWVRTMRLVEIANVRPHMYKFYTST